MDELLKAIGMYQDSVQAAATTSAVTDAAQFANQIHASTLNEAQQRAQMQGLGNQLALRLVGTGARADQIASAFQATQPKQFATPEAAIQEGVLTGNKQLQQLGSTASDAVFNKQIKQADIKDQLAAKADGRKFLREIFLQSLKDKQGKQLTNDELKPITDADTTLDSIDNVTHLFNRSDSAGVGKVASRVPDTINNWLGNNDAIVMETEMGKMQAAYKKFISGATVSEQERVALEKNLPSISDSPGVFNTKLQAFKGSMERAKNRQLVNFGIAGRDISGFREQAQQKAQSAAFEKQQNQILQDAQR